MIEPTDEMIRAFDLAMTDVCLEEDETRRGLAAVLALVEPACGQPHPAEDGVRCELPRDHGGSHSATVTRELWWFARESDGRTS